MTLGSLATYMLIAIKTEAIAMKIIFVFVGGTGLATGVLNACVAATLTIFSAGALFMASTLITACALKALASKAIAYCTEQKKSEDPTPA